jgi:hypothetical protein
MNDICIAFLVILAVSFNNWHASSSLSYQRDQFLVASGVLRELPCEVPEKCEATLRTRYPIIREQPESRFTNYPEIADKLSGRRAGLVTIYVF